MSRHTTAPDASRGALVPPALAALQWARLAAWLLAAHEDTVAPTIALDRAALLVDLTPSRDGLAAELAPLDTIRARWCALGDHHSARLAALDAVRRALMACSDALDGQAGERDSGVRETVTLTLRAWRLYAGDQSETVAAVVDSAARLLAPLAVLASLPRPASDRESTP